MVRKRIKTPQLARIRGPASDRLSRRCIGLGQSLGKCKDSQCASRINSKRKKLVKKKTRPSATSSPGFGLGYTFAMSECSKDSEGSSDITRLIGDWQAGDADAAQDLCRLLYQRLHSMAVGRLRGEARQVTLQPTVLVHEVVIELLRNAPQVNDQSHLLALASRMMRQFLVDEARRRGAQRRGGDQLQVTLDAERHGQRDEVVDLIELDSVLEKLEAQDERKARAIELHYFGGLDYNEMAAELGVSRATAHRELRFARAFLAAELGTAEG